MTATTTPIYGAATPPRVLRVQADDGCSLALHVMQEASGGATTPVVFLHALAMDGAMWQGVADALGPGLPLYAMDCRGHGASGRAAGPYSTARCAQDLVQVLDALGAPRAHVVGCSMGGTVALAFAARFAQRVASLTVIDATAWYGPEAPVAWEQRAQTALQGGMAALREFQLARWFSPGFAEAHPTVAHAAMQVFLANDVSAYAASCRMLGSADERAALSAYTGPAAIVVGEDDYATPIAMAQDIVDRLPDARLSVIPGTRHYTPLEAPGPVAACIAAVVERADAAALPSTRELPCA